MAEAAHITHEIKHSFALLGLIAGIVIGIVVAVAIVGTGGAALALVAAVCTGISIGGGLGKMIGKHIPGPPSGKLVAGHPTVLIGGKPIAKATTPAACLGQFVYFFSHPSVAAQGSSTVLVGGMPFSRKGDKMTCGAVIGAGDDNVNVGGETATVLPISEEVPAWVDWALLVIGLVGGWGALRTMGMTGIQIAARLGLGTLGAFGGGMGGSWLGGYLFGEGSWGQDLMGLGGGLLGGWLGFRAGSALTPKPNDVFLFRKDNNPESPIGKKPTYRKSSIDSEGNLNPANAEGKTTVTQHVRGSEPTKSDSPYTSFSAEEGVGKDYGGKTVKVNQTELQKDIQSGKVKDVEIVEHEQVLKAHDESIKAAQDRYDANPSDKNNERLIRAQQDKANSVRDKEVLIKGKVPSKYVTVVD
jgi:uncharacterized Zn-binding protein involved in type VI secretion